VRAFVLDGDDDRDKDWDDDDCVLVKSDAVIVVPSTATSRMALLPRSATNTPHWDDTEQYHVAP
jgi:hypothetical protein